MAYKARCGSKVVVLHFEAGATFGELRARVAAEFDVGPLATIAAGWPAVPLAAADEADLQSVVRPGATLTVVDGDAPKRAAVPEACAPPPPPPARAEARVPMSPRFLAEPPRPPPAGPAASRFDAALSYSRGSEADATPAAPAAAAATWTCSACTFINVDGVVGEIGIEMCSVCGTPKALSVAADAPLTAAPVTAAPSEGRCCVRRPVDADGNCLFVALAYLLRGSRPDKAAGLAAAALMRRACAARVLGDPEAFPDGALEKPRREYGAWIESPETWGGAVELSVLAHGGSALGADAELASKFSDVVVCAVDVRSGVLQRYGEAATDAAGEARRGAVYLIYDGVHYDPLVFSPEGAAESAADITVVAANDEGARALALAAAADFRKRRQFVDTASFALQCLVCGQGLRGQQDAQDHAAHTGHTNFAQTGH
ncbi:hypothetical protein M885DRAFT_619703 [Pelagophyceae sp. CCMP2097]|nr:hypothetical protein M885DRAFT_619703 [Pelagophyceae sp. CCMP2097]